MDKRNGLDLFILAAGQGTRLRPLTYQCPKVLVEIHKGKSLLDLLVQEAEKSGVFKNIMVIGGYKIECIKRAIADLSRRYPALSFFVIENPFYALSGPLVSLEIARRWGMGRHDFVVCNGDTFYSHSAFLSITEPNRGIVLGVDRCCVRKGDAVKVVIDSADRLVDVGKDISSEVATGVSAGIVLVRGRPYREVFCRTLKELVIEESKRNAIWHSLVRHLIQTEVQINVVYLSSQDWHEIDTLQELEELRKKLKR